MKYPIHLLFVLILLNFFCCSVSGQISDWSTKIAPILYKNCSSCHHDGAIAPFPLMSYGDAFNNAFAIQLAVNNKQMPPWPADPAYRNFAYQAILDSGEINAINDWINNGMPIGDTMLAPPAPLFLNNASLLDTINYIVQIPPYTLQYNTDEYRYFAMHSGFTDTVYVNQIEVIPGLPQIVHHADIHYDLTGNSFLDDSLTPLPGFSSGLVSNYYMNAWQPGGNIASYPPNWGIMVPPGADFVLEIHYGPGGIGLTDSTKMNLRFITNPVNVRPVHVGWLLNNPVASQGPLIIPPDSVITFNQLSAPMPVSRSLISICPHMHKLGKSYQVWFTTPAGDSVPLINIPNWDFHWQKYYMFEKVQKIPAGSLIHSIASFDNTSNNPENPNNPPITVYSGPTTNDEMLMTYFIFATYQSGDENIALDTTLITTVPYNFNYVFQETSKIYPNPAINYFTIEADAPEGNFLFEVINIFGQVMEEKIIFSENNKIKKNIDVSDFLPGIYFYRLTNSIGIAYCGKLIVQ